MRYTKASHEPRSIAHPSPSDQWPEPCICLGITAQMLFLIDLLAPQGSHLKKAWLSLDKISWRLDLGACPIESLSQASGVSRPEWMAEGKLLPHAHPLH